MMLKRIGILSVAKWQTLIGLLSGLFAGVAYAGWYCIYYRTLSVGVASWYLLTTPILYGVVTFLATVIGGVVYNSLAGSLGGMVLEFDSPRDEYDQPPQPSEDFLKRPPA
jgi:hypothetical protein